MPDRRQQRKQRVRQEAGSSDPRSVGATNRDPVKEEPPSNNVSRPQKKNTTGVAYAEPKEYESVTIMPDKEAQENQKYKRREILSNWLRYDDLPPENAEEDGEDYLVGEDFSTILEQQVSSGGHLMLKGESLLDNNETNILKSHGLGALHVADLVAAINTIPLQTQLNIPESALPNSVVKFYSNLANDHKKVYQPSDNYADCLDVNDKILASLKLSDNEPLNLANEVAENPETLNKNAVDVALSLSSAFEPEPEDVDLDLLVEEPTSEKSEEVRQPSPLKEQSPLLLSETLHQPIPDKELESQRQSSPEKQPSPVPEKEPSPVLQKDPSPVPHKQPSPAPQKQPSPAPQKQRSPAPQKQPSPAPQKQASPAPQKQPSPAPQKQPSPAPKDKSDSKEKSPAAFNFGLPKTSASNIPMSFGLSKPDLSSGIQTNSVIANALKDVDLGTKAEDIVPDGPTIDLDAPVTQAKPVLLISKTEEEDLEDWLDSVLDD